ncbi:outer membrane beta-barrel protein [Flavobacterium sp.]|uniref:outer membrane beta-barrel protein n=1 Tax=Flavobacterium sp. TaxID=239 RepID=UPI00121CC3C0|nr:outer membrane beta-barrel protein [Flavobacterium sp.]RZJ72530.1 MAG: PorT family protein [Flavobacterium sp.]
MRKILLVAIFLVGCAMNAQVKFAPGIRAGANFAQLTESETGIKTDFYIGGFAGIKFTKHYTLQPEVIYSRQGAEGDYRIYDPLYDNNGNLISEYRTENVDVSLQYLSVALMNKFTFADRISIAIGPSIDALVKHSTPVQNDVDLTIQLGLGVRLIDGLEAEVRLKKGVVNAITDEPYIDNDEFFGFEDGTNFVVQVGLSYTFGR